MPYDIIPIYGDRSKGPCKEFELQRQFMLCWEPSRKFFFRVRESNMFIREEWSFPDKGILINNHT